MTMVIYTKREILYTCWRGGCEHIILIGMHIEVNQILISVKQTPKYEVPGLKGLYELLYFNSIDGGCKRVGVIAINIRSICHNI